MKKIFLAYVSACIVVLSCSKSDSTNNNNNTGTLPTIATSSSSDITNITSSGASFNATITSDGSSSLTAKGVCWSTSQNPTTADNKTVNLRNTGSSTQRINNTSFTAVLTGLTPNTTYYARVYATNSSGTSYGNQVSFRTLNAACGATVTDIDGNVYDVVTIGTQCWMQENLKVSRFRNGDSIPTVSSSLTWYNQTTPAQCYYGFNPAFIPIAGRLYNWFAVNDSRGLAPTGWHVANDVDWTTIQNYLGGIDSAGGRMKQAGTTYWQTPNEGATNSSGFTALPAGFRYDNGPFSDLYMSALFWSATEISNEGNRWYLEFNDMGFQSNLNRKQYGFSVRCVKD